MVDFLGNTQQGLMNPDPHYGDGEFAQPLQIPNTDQQGGFESQTPGGLLTDNGMIMLSDLVKKMKWNICIFFSFKKF